MYSNEARLEQFLYLGGHLRVLEVILQSVGVLLHLLEDAAHGGVAQDLLHFRVRHGALANLARENTVHIYFQ